MEDLTDCDGASDADILANRECFVPMATITDPAQYALELGDLVVAKVSAFNVRGSGQFSGTNIIGALAETIPAAPTNAPRRGSRTKETQIEILWDFLSGDLQTGGTEILSYEL